MSRALNNTAVAPFSALRLFASDLCPDLVVAVRNTDQLYIAVVETDRLKL
jgi:hypothetical protein